MAIQIGGIGQNNIIDNLRGNTAIGAQTGSNPTQAAAATEIQSAQSSGSSAQPSENAQSQAVNNLISRPKGSWSKRTERTESDDAGAPDVSPEPEVVEATPESTGLPVRQVNIPGGSSTSQAVNNLLNKPKGSWSKRTERTESDDVGAPDVSPESTGLPVRQVNIPGGSTTRMDPVPTYIDVTTGEPKQPLVSELIGKGIQAGADAVQTAGENVKLAGRIAFTDPASGKLVNRPLIESVPAWKEAGVSYAEQAEAFGTVAGIAALPLGATTKIGGRVIHVAAQAAPKVAGSAGRTIGGIFGFGSLASVGGETEFSKITSEWSENIRQRSSQIIGGAKTPAGKVAATLAAVPLGAAGGLIEGVGTIPSAFLGAGKLASSILNPVGAANTFLGGADSSVRGFMQWVDDSKANPAYAIGETIGFSGAYKGATGAIGKGIQLTGKYTGIIDTRIIDTGNLVSPQNPLLSASINAGATPESGFIRIDSAPRAVFQGTHIRVLDNVGTRVNIETPSGKPIVSLGKSNPLTAEGELDLQRSQSEYPLYANQKGLPFIYGTASLNKAGTFEGFLDSKYQANKPLNAILSSLLPIEVNPKAGRITTYNPSDSVEVSGVETVSKAPYQPGKMTEYYTGFTGLRGIDTSQFKGTLKSRKGFTPLPTPKQSASGDNIGGSYWLIESEREHAWTTPDLTNPRFKNSFGGYTASGIKILKLGSSDTLATTLKNNFLANINQVRNPAARVRYQNKITQHSHVVGTQKPAINIRNAQRDVINFYGRDVAFRLSEFVGKPQRLDFTNHGSQHVENVASLAQMLKQNQPKRYRSVTDKEIYFAGILHDAAKNTDYESVPGGHGEMVGSVIRSGASLDARSYLRKEAVAEFESILGKKGTADYNKFLKEWDSLTPKQKRNVANAISQHTTNLKSQTHRITANKLGRLISDADRIELRRYAANPEQFKLARSAIFASPDIISKVSSEFYGSAPELRESRRATGKAQPKSRESSYTSYTHSKPGRGYEYAFPGTLGGVKLLSPVNYNYKQNGLGGGILTPYTTTSSYSPGRPYTGNNRGYSRGYTGIGYSAARRTTGTPYKGNTLREDPFKEIRRRRDDEKNRDKSATYNRIRIGTRRHLGIADPLEVLGMGSMTKRSGKTLERVTLKDELTWSKRPVYEFDGGYSTRKPKGRTRRR